ncbi:Mitochodrial transcription termination factor-related [Macleaya cordata]|uniref:Mitochodrial transcription termination factor-related n=1 Tax=Macleaya cordata TaxID=56857 RepID=A0A200Q2I1_MACCD|nr:Mitochodrial transcription termination factor-related [Macleaya cordata]
MHFFTITCSSSLYNSISRHFSSLPRLPKLRKIPYKHRARTILQAQQALTDYLHATRSLSFNHAEHISKNSLFSLSDLISRVEFSPSNFSRNFQKFLRYHPINEFEFFFESIGITHSEINGFLPTHEFFLSEEGAILNVANSLSAFGFPWNRLGILYKEEISIFSKNPETLTSRLDRFKNSGFDTVSVVGICLVFPFVLNGNDVVSDELFDFLKRVILDFDLMSSVEGNVDAWYEICRKIRFFYDLGCEKGQLGELMGRNQNVILDYSEQVLVEKVDFFCRMNANKEDVGLLLLRCPDILNFDLESPVLSVFGFLKHAGLSDEELNSITVQYPYVLGKNRLENLPHLMRALNLHDWLFDKIMKGEHHLLANFVIIGNPNEDVDIGYQDSLKRIQSTKNHYHTMGKLNFLHGIGFGENLATIKALSYLHGTRNELQERFDCLLQIGIEFSNLCKIVSLWPKILNQNTDMLEQKVIFLREEMGCSLQYLDVFPGYLCFDLENRIKPRYRIHMWLKEKGFVKRNYSIASILATSEKRFIARLFSIHPAAPKQWLECFSSKNHSNSIQETNLLII